MNSYKRFIIIMIVVSSLCLLSSCGTKGSDIDKNNEAQESIGSVDIADENVSIASSSETSSKEMSVSYYSGNETNSGEDNTSDHSTDASDDKENNNAFDPNSQSTSASPAKEIQYEPVEMNSLQTFFASITSSTTKADIDEYLEENDFEVYELTGNGGYLIGYETSAIRTRGRDREGEAVDISFATSGDPDLLGTVVYASYAVHTGSSTHTQLEFKKGMFYYETRDFKTVECADGYEAVQRYLTNNYMYAIPIK